MPTTANERIIAAAVFYGATISLPPPARHHTILQTMELVMGIDALAGGHHQGFLTDLGRYVNRVEGYYIAHRAGQLIRNTSGDPELYSEDLW